MSAAEALEQAAEKRRLRRATRKVVEYLSASVMAISSVLDQEAILFGGGTSEAGEALLARIRLIRAGLGTDSQLYGALWGALKVAEGRLPEAGKGALPNFERRASRRLIRAKRSERSKGDRSPLRQKR